ncbi:hypothetical protein B0H14DRAFT_2625132 [Mycena olivaceomarginata]|nr:hypothetical protein B0H14DRAFT_2625132 [Mycena olivaceomarginata]
MNKQSEFFDSREMPLPALFRAAGYDQNTRIAGLSDVDGPDCFANIVLAMSAFGYLWRRTGAAPPAEGRSQGDPIPDDAEASAIERENSGWDDSQARLHTMEPKDGALTTAERVKQARRDKAQELQQRRAAAAQATKAAEDAEAAALDVRLRHSRVVLAANPAAAFQLPRRTLKRSFLPTTPQRPRHSLRSAPPNTVASSSTVPQISRRRDDYLDPDYSFVCDTDAIGFPCFHREPKWSEASDEDGYDPAGGLPYVLRWNVSSRRAAAMVVLAAQLTPEEEAELALKRARDERREEDRNKVRNALKPVHAQIIELGAERREWDCT